MQLTITDAEADVLRETLLAVLDELSVEIRRTDSPDYRAGLHARRDALQNVLKQLEAH